MDTKIENIKSLYLQVDKKKDAVELIASELNKNPSSLWANWFNNFLNIPDKHQDEIITLLQNIIISQNKNESRN